MVKMAVFVHVNKDGVGDLTHFLDIYNTYKKMDIELIPIIGGYPENIDHINEKLNANHISTDYCGLVKAGILQLPSQKKEELKKHFSESIQIMLISYGNFTPLLEFESSFNENALVKFIAEHESLHVQIGRELKNHEDMLIYAMGLSAKTYGIKLSDVDIPSISVCQKIIEKDNPEFLNKLFQSAGVNNFEDFLKKKVFLPFQSFSLHFHRLSLLKNWLAK